MMPAGQITEKSNRIGHCLPFRRRKLDDQSGYRRKKSAKPEAGEKACSLENEKVRRKTAADHHHGKAQQTADDDLATTYPVSKCSGNERAQQHTEQGD